MINKENYAIILFGQRLSSFREYNIHEICAYFPKILMNNFVKSQSHSIN